MIMMIKKKNDRLWTADCKEMLFVSVHFLHRKLF